MKTVQVQTTTTTTRTMHVCEFCEFKAESPNQVLSHMWKEHFRSNSETHLEDPGWGADEIEFRKFSSETEFNAFCAEYCNVRPTWRGPGWYLEYTYQDYCRGCDMGETTGLRKLDDDEVTWENEKTEEEIKTILARLVEALDDLAGFDDLAPPTSEAGKALIDARQALEV